MSERPQRFSTNLFHSETHGSSCLGIPKTTRNNPPYQISPILTSSFVAFLCGLAK